MVKTINGRLSCYFARNQILRGEKKHLTHIQHTKPLTLSRKKNPMISIAVSPEILITSRADAWSVVKTCPCELTIQWANFKRIKKHVSPKLYIVTEYHIRKWISSEVIFPHAAYTSINCEKFSVKTFFCSQFFFL